MSNPQILADKCKKILTILNNIAKNEDNTPLIDYPVLIGSHAAKWHISSFQLIHYPGGGLKLVGEYIDSTDEKSISFDIELVSEKVDLRNMKLIMILNKKESDDDDEDESDKDDDYNRYNDFDDDDDRYNDFDDDDDRYNDFDDDDDRYNDFDDDSENSENNVDDDDQAIHKMMMKSIKLNLKCLMILNQK
ncbi:unnamed protein product [Rhizophagus irregularis]|nr:unnamed protein product [Rhizophagus irregularis]